MEDREAAVMLLNHRANPNLQDSEGNSPLHTLSDQYASSLHQDGILKGNGKLLVNMASQMPAVEELFFDQKEKDVKDLDRSVKAETEDF